MLSDKAAEGVRVSVYSTQQQSEKEHRYTLRTVHAILHRCKGIWYMVSQYILNGIISQYDMLSVIAGMGEKALLVYSIDGTHCMVAVKYDLDDAGEGRREILLQRSCTMYIYINSCDFTWKF